MYFASRVHAGRMLADQIVPEYDGRNPSILALSDGGVIVGLQIAQALRCPLNMLMIGEIELPHELVSIAGIAQDGSFAYNQAYSSGEIEEIVGEYRGVIEEQKLEKMQEMQRRLGGGGLIRRDLLTDRNIIIVSDGMKSGFALDMAKEFLKPVPYQKLVVATPLASLAAVDRMHIIADDLYCLNVVEDYISTDHYYDTQDVPAHDAIVQTVSYLLSEWGRF